MSSGCGDVLSLADLQTAKKHQIFEAEVITGKSGGVAGGADIDYATNAVTGQVQKTMPAILRDVGFEPAGFDFTSGGTLNTTDRNKAVLWPMADGGDGDWYYWEGALPKVIPASSTPASTGGVLDGAWRPVGDITLRGDLFSPSGASIVGKDGGGVVSDAMPVVTNLTILVPEDFPDIASAIESLSQKLIANGAEVVIDVANGSYAWPTQVLSHPDAEKITITSRGGLGSITSFSGTAVAAVTGSRGAYEVKISCSPGSSVSAGDVVAISNIVGDYDAEVLGGCYRVSAVDAVSITVTVRYWQSGWAIASLTSCTIRKAPVVVDFSGQDGFVNKSSNFGKIFGIFARGMLASCDIVSVPSIHSDSIIIC